MRQPSDLGRCQGDVFQHGLVREQVKALKHHADFGAQRIDIGFGFVHRHTMHQHLSARGILQTIQAAKKRAFA